MHKSVHRLRQIATVRSQHLIMYDFAVTWGDLRSSAMKITEEYMLVWGDLRLPGVELCLIVLNCGDLTSMGCYTWLAANLSRIAHRFHSNLSSLVMPCGWHLPLTLIFRQCGKNPTSLIFLMTCHV